MPGVSAYICLYIYLYHRGLIQQRLSAEVSVDTQFILAGMLAFIFT